MPRVAACLYLPQRCGWRRGRSSRRQRRDQSPRLRSRRCLPRRRVLRSPLRPGGGQPRQAPRARRGLQPQRPPSDRVVTVRAATGREASSASNFTVRGERGLDRQSRRARVACAADPLQARACAVPALGIAAAYSEARTAHGPETVGGSILSGGGLQYSPEHGVAFERGQRCTESANRQATIPQLPGRSIDGGLLVSGALHREPHRTAGRGCGRVR